MSPHPPQPSEDPRDPSSTPGPSGIDQTVSFDQTVEIDPSSPVDRSPVPAPSSDRSQRIDETVHVATLDRAPLSDDGPIVDGGATVVMSSVPDVSADPVSQADDAATPRDAVDSGGVVNRGEQTVQFGPSDQTIEIASEGGSGLSDSNEPVNPAALTVRQGTGGTVSPGGAGATVMASRQIDRTIHSAELTGQDAAIWGNLTKQTDGSLGVSQPGSRGGSQQGSHGSSQSGLPRASDSGIVDTRLNLRTRQLVEQNSPPELGIDADYRLVRLLGKGGMGNVYIARQGSLDRFVAVKVIKPLEDGKREQLAKRGTLEKTERQRRSQFITEAVVTGDLEHPNIVPIHDIAVSEDNTLFYAMKRVSGTPWSKVIAEKSRDENIEILLKVCDAIGFAHTRGIVHRDIKPENIMLGDFGIVMVMDWGLALAQPGFEKLQSIHPATGLGGSPAYMAPEMATGPLSAIGPPSDIYLLGATLFQIITGETPHQAPNITECLRAVAKNTIRDASPGHHGELLDIALRAMETRPEDRYPDVLSFQDAIRSYRSHSESISLATKALEELSEARQNKGYNRFARAMFGFEEAILLWDDNLRARVGLEKAKVEYAEAAYRNGDFDLGLSLLDIGNARHQELIQKIRDAQQERLSRQSRLQWLRRGVVALLAFIILGGAVSIYAIRNRADAATRAMRLAEANAKEAFKNLELANFNEARAIANYQTAEKNRKDAEAQTAEARRQRMLADRSAQEAKRQEAEARRQQSEAERQRERSEYESYVSRINLVKARIEQNEFDDARRVLEDLRRERGDQGLGWEWRWLSRLTRRATDSLASDDAVSDLAISPSGSKGIAVLDNGTVRSATVLPSRGLAWTETEYANLASLRNVVAVAISGDDSRVAVALAGGDIEIWDDRFGDRVAVCQGHQATARTLRFTDSGLLVSGSDDRTARLWDTASGKELATCWHLGPVKDVAVSGRGDGLQVVAAVAEAATGYAEVWTLRPPTGDAETPWRSESLGSFRGHVAPVLAVAASPDGRMVASGDAQGRCFLWRPDQVDSIDYRSAIASAIKRVSGDDSAAIDTDGDQRSVEDLSSPDLGTADERFLVELSDRSAGRAALGPSSSGSSSIGAEGAGADPASVSPPAHRDAIRSIAFHPDGQTIVTASDDYTLGLWDRSTVRMIDSLRGHGGSVRGVSFLGRAVDNGPLRVVSASSDKTIKTWVESSPHRQDLSAGLAAGQSPQTGLPASEAARQATRLRLHDDAITSVRFDPTGQRIVTTSIDQTAKVLRFDPGSQTFQPEMLLSETVDPETLAEGSSFLALSLAIDRANRRLFIGSADAVVRVWDWEQATEIGRIEATGLNESLALTADGRFLLTGSSSPEISAVLWRVETLTPFEARKVNEFAGHTQAVTAFSVSPDGRFVFTGDRGGIGYLWDRETGGQIGDRLEQVRGYRINVATFTADGSQILIAADDQNLSRIDLSTRQIVSRFAHDGPVVGIGLSPDGRRVATVSERSESGRLVTAATLWDTQSGEKKSLGTAASSRSTGSPDGSSDGRADMPVPSDPFGRIVTADFSPNGSTLVVGYETGEEKRGELRIWDAGSVQRARNVGGFRLPESVGPVTAAAAITDDQLITLDGDSAFWWDLATQSHVRSFAANGSLARASFSADGQSIATVSQGVKIWDVAAGRSVIKVELPHAGPVYAAEFSPAAGSTLFATAGDDGLVKLWNWNAADRSVDKVRQWELAGPKTAIRRLAFSDDGARLAAVGDRGVIRVLSTDSPTVWNYDLGRPDQPFADALTSVAISRGGQWLAVGGTDAKGRIWRLPPVGVEATSDTVSAGETVVPILLQGHADRIEDIRFLEDGTSQIRVLTASRDKSARVWDPQIGSPQAVAREILMLRGHAFGVTGIDVDPDHQTVVTSGTDGQVILWPADPVASRAEGLDN